MTTAEPRPVYVIRLRPEPGVDAMHALRAALKFLLRRCGLRVISIDAIGQQENNNGL